MLLLFGCVLGSDSKQDHEFYVTHVCELGDMVWKDDTKCRSMQWCITRQPFDSHAYNSLKDIQFDLCNHGHPLNAIFVAKYDVMCCTRFRVITPDSETDVFCDRVTFADPIIKEFIRQSSVTPKICADLPTAVQC